MYSTSELDQIVHVFGHGSVDVVHSVDWYIIENMVDNLERFKQLEQD